MDGYVGHYSSIYNGLMVAKNDNTTTYTVSNHDPLELYVNDTTDDCQDNMF